MTVGRRRVNKGDGSGKPGSFPRRSSGKDVGGIGHAVGAYLEVIRVGPEQSQAKVEAQTPKGSKMRTSTVREKPAESKG